MEAALSIHLENFATSLGSREQLAIAEFADALLVIPKTLAANAAKDATELVAKLRAYHYTAQVQPCLGTSPSGKQENVVGAGPTSLWWELGLHLCLLSRAVLE